MKEQFKEVVRQKVAEIAFVNEMEKFAGPGISVAKRSLLPYLAGGAGLAGAGALAGMYANDPEQVRGIAEQGALGIQQGAKAIGEGAKGLYGDAKLRGGEVWDKLQGLFGKQQKQPFVPTAINPSGAIEEQYQNLGKGEPLAGQLPSSPAQDIAKVQEKVMPDADYDRVLPNDGVPILSQEPEYDESLAQLKGKIQNPNSETAPPRKGDKMDRTLSGMALGHEPFQMKTRGIEKYWEDKPIYGQPDTPATGEESRRVEEKIRRLEQPIGEKNLENIRAGG